MHPTQIFFRAPATAAIATVCLVVYAVAALQAGSPSDTVWGSPLGIRMVLYGPFVAGEGPSGWLRVLSAAFLHLDLAHLCANMLMLVLIGGEVERWVGTARFLLAYLAGALTSSLAVLAGSFGAPTAGASGALFALLALLVAIAYRRHLDPRAPLALVVANVAFTFFAPNVSIWGHLGGLAAGVVLAWPLASPRDAS
ncbi:rhomboid family intramembrane serine protease [Corynebacterium liangguodongii]|uniref:Rhomboid family intramembrane serine protease n=1 Tax=Corynebacterium liangguodongii TaxID=2079535 RepID=A0A2S0WBG7_9CORY|nr:rhomboid family intramembrane serine protease [Corynebacterium liangguodongii]AWB83103.1 rhomboid family intramembrane serine protease [Corynebacterium liangguodongii]PWB99296.1 rhomboid family intramembrane serine protease [Corynebacterium liangguodongii]